MTTMESIEAQMRNGRWREAQRACHELIYSRPTDPRLHALEGIAFFRLGEFAQAEPCFMRATALDPNFVDAGIKRCQCLERLRMFDHMLHLAREWQAKRPSDPTLKSLLHTYGLRPDASRTEPWEMHKRSNRSVHFAA